MITETTKNQSGRAVIVIDKFSKKFKEWAYIHSSRTLLFVYKSAEGYFGVQCTNNPEKEFKASNSRKLFPEEWRGLREGKLQKISGYSSAIFCDPQGYIAGFSDFEDAISAAKEIANSVSLSVEY
jgi:uncharacterized UPF0160 family protein